MVEGKPLVMPVPPVIVEGRTLIGVRSVGEAVGGTVDWDQAKRQATVTRFGDTVVLTLGKTEALVNGQPVTLPVPAQLVNERTMVPLRFIAEALGGSAEWDEATRTANILRKPTNITGLTYAKAEGKASIVLSLTEAPISIKPQVNGNNLSLDLYPAKVATDQANLTANDALLKTASLKANGRTVHLEAQLTAPPAYKYSLSPDGKTLTVDLEYTVTGVQTAKDGRIARVNIATTGKLNYTTYPVLKTALSPNRVVVEITGGNIGPDVPATLPVTGSYFARVRTAQHSRDPDSVWVVLDMVDEIPPYDVIATDQGLTIQFMPVIQAVKTDKLPGKTRLTLVGSMGLDAKVTVPDGSKQVNIEVPQAKNGTGAPAVKIGDGTIDTVSFATGTLPTSTLITIALPYYLGHTVVSKDGDANIVIDLITSPVYGKRIWIDAGHGQVPGGADDPGSIGKFYKTQEDDVNLEVALELQKRLQAAGATVYMTRTGSPGVDFRDRPKLVNAVKPAIDLFISIHHNSSTSTSTRGTETYYWTTNPKSKIAAQKIHPAVIRLLGFPDRGVRTDSFYVIKETLAPAVLVELGYLSNQDEEKAIAEPGAKVRTYPGKAAEALKVGIFDYFYQNVQK
ncbi:MAG TPA: N-acetylmuramoyl-L-alanine amidase family protein [Symbiobacteriaceae bacterium]|jgi:N-acetylmuramoyl-L-alanine amidase